MTTTERREPGMADMARRGDPAPPGLRARMAGNVHGARSRLERKRSPRPMGPIVWKWPLAVMIVLVLLAMVTLDTVVAANRLPQGSFLLRSALVWTDVAKTYTILVPTVILLVGSSVLDWGKLKPRARLLWLQWTAVAAYLFVSVMLTELIVTLLKYAVGRARPSLFLEVGAFQFDPLMFHFRYASFPSGHSGTAGSATMALALLFPRLRVPLLILALWLAATRVLVVAHYPSDIIAGLMIGAWLAYVVAVMFARYGLLFEMSHGVLPRPRRSFHVLPASSRIAGERRGRSRRTRRNVPTDGEVN